MHWDVPGPEFQRYMDLANLELKLTAQNMANVDTPGYRAVGFDFEAEMKRSLAELTEQKAPGDADRNSLTSGVSVAEVSGLLERPDGNNVSMDREGLNLAEAQLRFTVGEKLVKDDLTGIQNAIQIK
jgi:flagellar basal-body rod protein FlgB